MRFRHADGTLVHLAYGTNVHPAENLDGVITQLARYGEPIRRRLGASQLGLGLWIAAPVVAELVADRGCLARLRRALDRHGLEVVTLNSFPYAGFHAASVKKAVYHPDWTSQARLDYTLDCARALAVLLPDDVQRGSLSTLPLAWREPWSAEQAGLAQQRLDALASGLAAVEGETGRTIRVGFEPEPGCLVEDTTQAASLLAGLDTDRLGVCVDSCHLAVAFEDPAAACTRLAGAGLPIVKVQASCALQVDEPADPAARAALEQFIEPRFLHQTRQASAGRVLGADDLPDALAGQLSAEGPWRVHFHVPLHAELPPPLRTTRPTLLSALETMLGGAAALTDHVEVETYTWSVWPDGPTSDDRLVTGLAAEVSWIRDRLVSLGMKEYRP